MFFVHNGDNSLQSGCATSVIYAPLRLVGRKMTVQSPNVIINNYVPRLHCRGPALVFTAVCSWLRVIYRLVNSVPCDRPRAPVLRYGVNTPMFVKAGHNGCVVDRLLDMTVTNTTCVLSWFVGVQINNDFPSAITHSICSRLLFYVSFLIPQPGV